MPTFRPNTWDENIWNSIVTGNEYSIHNNWPHNVIDIGGHIGSFSFFMLQHRGCKRSIVLEPDPGNFKLLQNNLKEFIDNNQATAINAGIGKPDHKLKLFQHVPDNTGGIAYVPSSEGQIDTVTLDSLIDMLDDSPILLKLDCEGCEYEAIRSCTKLHRINAIVGEFHVRLNQTEQTLRKILTSQGFLFNYHHTSNHIGLFGAHQPKKSN